MPGFFEKMQRQSRLADDGAVPSYLRTHPMTVERIADTAGRAASAPYRQHLDSLEFHLVRAKLARWRAAPRWSISPPPSATGATPARPPRYGLGVALLRAGRAPGASAIAALRIPAQQADDRDHRAVQRAKAATLQGAPRRGGRNRPGRVGSLRLRRGTRGGGPAAGRRRSPRRCA
jgi:predicted Zn-dependent protease